MHELSQAYANNLVQVETIERMLSKLNTTLTKDLKPADASDWLQVVGAHLKAAWNYEITSVDDRPITVRKVVAGHAAHAAGILRLASSQPSDWPADVAPHGACQRGGDGHPVDLCSMC